MLLDDSPSLKQYMGEQLTRAFELAVRDAASETGLPRAAFPDRCPYTIEQLRDHAFFPSGGG